MTPVQSTHIAHKFPSPKTKGKLPPRSSRSPQSQIAAPPCRTHGGGRSPRDRPRRAHRVNRGGLVPRRRRAPGPAERAAGPRRRAEELGPGPSRPLHLVPHLLRRQPPRHPHRSWLFELVLNAAILQPRGEFWGNNIQGTIPEEFGDLKNLISLDLYNNSISGRIPASLGNLSNLKFLRLDHNRLTGPIPRELAGLFQIVVMDLSNNDLSGTIPTTGVFQNIPPGCFANNPRLRGPGQQQGGGTDC